MTSETVIFNGTISPPNSSQELFNLTSFSPIISLHYELPFMIIVAVILLMLVITTIFGNVLVGLALFKFRQLRTVSNYLIGNLALSDLFLATTIMPLSGVYECLGHWVFGKAICYFWLSTDVLYCTASIWNLCIIALDRFTATLYPVWYREKRSTRQALMYIGLVWLFSFIICVPPMLGWNDLSTTYVYHNTTGVYQCELFTSRSYVMFSASGSFFLPFLITTFLYIRIFVVLKNRMERMRANTKSHQQKRAKHEAKNTPKPSAKASMPAIPPPDIELTVTTNQISSSLSDDPGSGTKTYFLTDADIDKEEESLTPIKSDNPLYISSSEPEAPTSLIRNGIKERQLEKDKDTLVILNPHHQLSDSERYSDQDQVQIVISNETSNPLLLRTDTDNSITPVSNNNLLDTKAPKVEVTSDDGSVQKKKGFKGLFKNALPSRERPHKPRVQRRYTDQREVRATIRMAIIIACFCGCWLGFFVIYVVRAWCPTCTLPRQIDAFFFWLGYSNSCMNPILYAIFNEEFRRAFQKLLGC